LDSGSDKLSKEIIMKNVLATMLFLTLSGTASASQGCKKIDAFSNAMQKNFRVCLDEITGCEPANIKKVVDSETGLRHLVCLSGYSSMQAAQPAVAPPPVMQKMPQQLVTSADMLETSAARTITPQIVKRAALNWAAIGETDAEPLVGDDGSIQYPYGASQPIVSCSPLHLCVVKLQEGEAISNVALGDSVRWKVQAASAGKFPMLVIKPTTINIKTNLTVMTDAGRIYYMTLVSYPNKWVPLISFYDPQKLIETVNQKTAIDAKVAKAEEEKTVATLPGEDITAMDFGFVSMGGSNEIKPVRVFASAGHTYIQMPDALKTKDAPAIFSLVNGEQQLVNFRVKGDYYILDGVPEKMNLVLGAGSNTKIVNILHKQK
jgi:type IV secretion system protein VirB9